MSNLMSDANPCIELPWHEPERVKQLLALLDKRIVVLDGAMGTMIQRHQLDEAGYRGTRFAEGFDGQHFAEGHHHGPDCGCGGDLKGNNDLLTLSRPQLIADIHRAYLDAGADLLAVISDLFDAPDRTARAAAYAALFNGALEES